MARPSPEEYAAYYENYVGLVPEAEILPALTGQLDEMLDFLRGVPESEGGVRHPPYSWSVKEVVGHLIDAERVFGYRALRFARGDETPLPGFDENAYVPAGEFDHLPLADLVDEFEHVRRSHLAFFRNLPEAAWSRKGAANGDPISVRALAFILVGHVRHHGAILRRRLAHAQTGM